MSKNMPPLITDMTYEITDHNELDADTNNAKNIL